MTLDEAIKRYEEDAQWEQYSMRYENIKKATEHRQLVEWLKELKRLRVKISPAECLRKAVDPDGTRTSLQMYSAQELKERREQNGCDRKGHGEA